MEVAMKKKFAGLVAVSVVMLLAVIPAFASQAIVQKVTGKCEVFTKADWVRASVGMSLYQSSKIRTKTAKSSCAILFEDGHTINIGGNTVITLSDLTSDKILVSIERGRVRSKVKKLSANKYYGVKTPTAVAAVRGTEFSVAFENQITRVEVFEGVVAAREEKTGVEVHVAAGEFTTVEQGKEPAKPAPLPEKSGGAGTEDQSKNEIKSEAQREIFLEISREAVMERAAEELKAAEYQNGKTMVDVFGKRVRLEEYIVRPKDNTTQFKYVVLNTRDNRFDFGKILFTFDKALPSDLSLATKDMYYKEGTTSPDYRLSAVDSVISNTFDKVLEEATGGDYLPGTTDLGKTNWTHYWGNYKFYVGNLNSTDNGGRGKLLYTIAKDSKGTPTTTAPNFIDSPASDKTLWSPVSGNTPSLTARDRYTDGWIQNDTYLINDDGKKTTVKESDFYKINFEQVYNSSLFKDKIDVVFSSKLLIDSGMMKNVVNLQSAQSLVRLNR
jgi:hypothetical protein